MEIDRDSYLDIKKTEGFSCLNLYYLVLIFNN